MSQSEVVGLKKDDASRPMSGWLAEWAGELKSKHSQSLTFNVEMSNSELVGNTKVNVHEHTIFVDGTELSERRVMEIILDGPSEGQSILKHTRRIDGQEYTVLEKRDHGQLTRMTGKF